MWLTGSSICWAFPKFHAIRHVPRLLIMFGCWENVSTQVNSDLLQLQSMKIWLFVFFSLARWRTRPTSRRPWLQQIESRGKSSLCRCMLGKTLWFTLPVSYTVSKYASSSVRLDLSDLSNFQMKSQPWKRCQGHIACGWITIQQWNQSFEDSESNRSILGDQVRAWAILGR